MFEILKRHKKTKHKVNRNVGKIGWCSAETLGLDVWHYVYIRKVKNGKCEVNTLSSIEDSRGRIEIPKVRYIEKGILYPIPSKDTNAPRFSGIDKRVIKNIDIRDIKQKGSIKIKGRHKHYINKYMK